MKKWFNSKSFFLLSILLLIGATFTIYPFTNASQKVKDQYGNLLFNPIEPSLGSTGGHVNAPGRPHHTEDIPDGWIHNDFKGNVYDTLVVQGSHPHNNFPGNPYHTLRYPPWFEHVNKETSPDYTYRVSPEPGGEDGGEPPKPGPSDPNELHNDHPGQFNTQRYKRGEERHVNLPGEFQDTMMAPLFWKHKDFPGRPGHTSYYPPSDTMHNNFPGRPHDTQMRHPEFDAEHSNFPGNPFDTKTYPKGFKHTDMPGRPHHTDMHFPDGEHTDFPGRPHYTEYHRPEYKHANHPGNSYDTDYWPESYKHQSNSQEPFHTLYERDNSA